jgi:hypothetical protein
VWRALVSARYFLGFLVIFPSKRPTRPARGAHSPARGFFFMVNACDIAYDFLILHRKNWCRIFCRFFSFQEIVTAVFFPPDSMGLCVCIYLLYTHVCVCIYLYKTCKISCDEVSTLNSQTLVCIYTHTNFFCYEVSTLKPLT